MATTRKALASKDAVVTLEVRAIAIAPSLSRYDQVQ
jgi:hypothetical protein